MQTLFSTQTAGSNALSCGSVHQWFPAPCALESAGQHPQANQVSPLEGPRAVLKPTPPM